jgi:hypothetical protein
LKRWLRLSLPPSPWLPFLGNAAGRNCHHPRTITVSAEPDVFVATESEIWVAGCSSNSVTANSIGDGAVNSAQRAETG